MDREQPILSWLHRHHNGSVNSKGTHTPKNICQVLTSPMALGWHSTSEQKRTKLLKLSLAKPSIPITFARFVFNYLKNLSFY